MKHDPLTCLFCDDHDYVPYGSPASPRKLNQSQIYARLSAVEETIGEVLGTIRETLEKADATALVEYGGKDFHRHSNIAITNLEQALLWLGASIPE